MKHLRTRLGIIAERSPSISHCRERGSLPVKADLEEEAMISAVPRLFATLVVLMVGLSAGSARAQTPPIGLSARFATSTCNRTSSGSSPLQLTASCTAGDTGSSYIGDAVARASYGGGNPLTIGVKASAMTLITTPVWGVYEASATINDVVTLNGLPVGTPGFLRVEFSVNGGCGANAASLSIDQCNSPNFFLAGCGKTTCRRCFHGLRTSNLWLTD